MENKEELVVLTFDFNNTLSGDLDRDVENLQ